MRIDVTARKPDPDALQNLERLAEEKRRLVRIVEVDRRQQRRTGRHMPERQEAEEQADLPEAQRPTYFVAGHSFSALLLSSLPRSGCAARRSAASAGSRPHRAAAAGRPGIRRSDATPDPRKARPRGPTARSPPPGHA